MKFKGPRLVACSFSLLLSSALGQSGPDYGNLQYWHAHPEKEDVSDRSPLAAFSGNPDADVFFVHATTYTSGWSVNGSLDRQSLRRKTEVSLLNDATVFFGIASIYAPSYRQVKLKQFLRSKNGKHLPAFETAYLDVKTAFETYLEQWNHGRPIILAGHGQGSLIAQRLLFDFFGSKSNLKLVVAILPGYPIPTELFQTSLVGLNYCDSATQTGCVMGWETYGKFASFKQKIDPLFWDGQIFAPIKDSLLYGTNPLSWSPIADTLISTDSIVGLRPSNNFKIPLKLTTYGGATRVVNGKLILYDHNKYLFNATADNLFSYDYNLFYRPLHLNIIDRIKAMPLSPDR